ncbi:MAG: Rieske 2Fe-2S domain-containing protein [Blastocatellales bacterium]|nr:Rieske 2Fe-2S domain-containing protein [Blastocatellales bacterium]
MNPLDFHFDERLEYAETLPSRFYTDPSILDMERERIFFGSWQLAGRLGNVLEPGSFFTTEILGEPILVVRDQNEVLRAFHNVCRHRAGRVAQGDGCRRVFQCGYHGWTYALDGRLLGAPDWEGVENFSRDAMGLKPVEVQGWEQFVFVRIASRQGEFDGADLATVLGDIPAATRNFRINEMRWAARRDYVIECNWKVYVDNYAEGYHIPIAHPSLMRELDYENYRTILGRYHSRQDAPIRREPDAERRYQATEQQCQALYFWVFPNLMLNIYPDNISTNVIIPLGPERTLTIFEWYFPEDELNADRVDSTLALSDEVQREDIAVCESVQQGLRSISYDRGRYSVKRENGVHQFHALWCKCMQEPGG